MFESAGGQDGHGRGAGSIVITVRPIRGSGTKAVQSHMTQANYCFLSLGGSSGARELLNANTSP